MLNKCMFIGRLTKDPEQRFTPNGNATCSFTLACDRPFKNAQGEKETDFINISIPPYKSKLAEICTQYLSKGKLAYVEGSQQTRSYTAQDGTKKYVTEIIGEDVKFLSPKDDGQSSQSAQGQTQPQHNQPKYQQPQQQNGFYPPQQPPAPGYPPNQSTSYPPNPQGSMMPPPPGYAPAPQTTTPNGQPQQGQQQQLSYGHQVNMPDDQIPF